MGFGIYVLPKHPWSELERRWALVEELGFDSVWDCDDLSCPNKRGEIGFDGLVVLAAMAARTTRVRIGTLMLSLPIRDNPAVLAKENHRPRPPLGRAPRVRVRRGDPRGRPRWRGARVLGEGRAGRTVPGSGRDRRSRDPRGDRLVPRQVLPHHRPVDLPGTRPAPAPAACHRRALRSDAPGRGGIRRHLELLGRLGRHRGRGVPANGRQESSPRRPVRRHRPRSGVDRPQPPGLRVIRRLRRHASDPSVLLGRGVP